MPVLRCVKVAVCLWSLVGLLMVGSIAVAADVATPWEQAYEGAEATGPQVIGLWKFDAADGKDSTGRLPVGVLRNGKLVAEGRFGGALESFAGFPERDQSHGFVVPNNPRLTPSGAFTIELWVKPKEDFAKRDWAVVIDKKYAGHDDYQLSFGPADPKGQKRLTLSLGFGGESQNFLSEYGDFPAGEWVHIAATYDGRGRVRFFRNGESFGGADVPGRGAISAGDLPLSIGDRLGSNYPGFPGFVDEVRLTNGVREFGRLRVAAMFPRRTFVRFEEAPKWTVRVTNLRREPISNAVLEVNVGGRPVLPLSKDATINKLEGGESHDVEFAFDTTLRPDAYTVTVSAGVGHVSNVPVKSTDSKKSKTDSPKDGHVGNVPHGRVVETYPVTLVARPLPERMPVVMWGIGGVKDVLVELPRLKQIGFTHCLGTEVDHQRAADATEPVLITKPEQLPAARAMLDTALANDLKIMAATWPGYFEPYLGEFVQTGRNGEKLKRRTLTPNAPKVMAAFDRLGESIAKSYGDHPAFEGVLVNSEVRDDSEVSFTEWDLAAYRRAFGPDANIPDFVKGKYPPSYTTLKDFPADRVVSPDHPQLAFYRWWWSKGDGWNDAHSAVHRGFKRASKRADQWTFTDPVVRCPPLWGSGGEVDVLSQWTYTDPDPLRMSLPVDEMFAMAGVGWDSVPTKSATPKGLRANAVGTESQPTKRVMKMTQLFWYRSTTAPAESSPREGELPAKWADQDPSTSFISIHPHHLREAFWTKIARPVEGIMYHGWSSLVPTDGSHAYKYTHPQLQHELTRLIHDVVEPLGPTLRQIPAVKSDIAFLESFTTFAFASRATWGYAGGWQADAYFAMQHARLQPEVIYEEHVLRDGLDAYKVLVMTDCEVLTRPVVDRVLAFQKRGGLIVGDSRLCPAIKADITLPILARTKDAAADKAALLKLAAEIRQQLDGKYQRVVDSSSPEVVPHRRRSGCADYIFLVNDAREPGDYVGQYGRVHELGVPTAAEVTVNGDVGAIYDLVEHRAVEFRKVDGTNRSSGSRQTSDSDAEAAKGQRRSVGSLATSATATVVPTTLGPCDGRVLMTLPQPIAAVSIDGAAEVARGKQWTGRISINDATGKPVDAVIPLHVEVRDGDGRLAEFSGYYGAAHGVLELKLDIAANDAFGQWEIHVRDLASGQRRSHFVRVTK